MNQTEVIVNTCIKLANNSGKAFSLKSNSGAQSSMITAEAAFAANGVLPAIAKRAEQICSMALGTELGATYKKCTKSPISREVSFNSGPLNSARIMIIADILLETIRFGGSEVISLDEFLYEHIEIS